MSLEKAAHKAVHDALTSGSDAALTALLGGRVYDRVPANAAKVSFPYAVPRIEVRDDANTCSNASVVHVTVNVYSDEVGSQEAEEIGGLIRAILAPADPNINLDIEGYLVTVSAFDIATYRQGDSPLITEGVLAFTYLVDPLS